MVKKIGFFNINENLNSNNRLFEAMAYELGDGLLRPYAEMRELGASDGFLFATTSAIDPEHCDALVFLDYPGEQTMLRFSGLNVPKYLIVCECPLIKPENWSKKVYTHFDKVFVYDRSRVDLKRTFHYLMPYSMARTQLHQTKANRMILVASNKLIVSEHSGYDDRRGMINFFRNRDYGDGFGMDLYGRGWEFYISWSRVVNRLFERLGRDFPWISRFSSHIHFYRGVCQNKNELIAGYRFVYCNENFSYPGYITEKIFDVLWAGSVPVYAGPPDVDDFIPPDVYVDTRQFKSCEQLVNYLRSMSDSEYQVMLKNGQDFLKSKEAARFDSSSLYSVLKAQLSIDLELDQ